MRSQPCEPERSGREACGKQQDQGATLTGVLQLLLRGDRLREDWLWECVRGGVRWVGCVG